VKPFGVLTFGRIKRGKKIKKREGEHRKAGKFGQGKGQKNAEYAREKEKSLHSVAAGKGTLSTFAGGGKLRNNPGEFGTKIRKRAPLPLKKEESSTKKLPSLLLKGRGGGPARGGGGGKGCIGKRSQNRRGESLGRKRVPRLKKKKSSLPPSFCQRSSRKKPTLEA